MKFIRAPSPGLSLANTERIDESRHPPYTGPTAVD
jgi:hypothetical protein